MSSKLSEGLFYTGLFAGSTLVLGASAIIIRDARDRQNGAAPGPPGENNGVERLTVAPSHSSRNFQPGRSLDFAGAPFHSTDAPSHSIGAPARSSSLSWQSSGLSRSGRPDMRTRSDLPGEDMWDGSPQSGDDAHITARTDLANALEEPGPGPGVSMIPPPKPPRTFAHSPSGFQNASASTSAPASLPRSASGQSVGRVSRDAARNDETLDTGWDALKFTDGFFL